MVGWNLIASTNVDKCAKLFGAALEVSDDPFSLQLKHASMWAREQGQKLQDDPYEAVLEQLIKRNTKIEAAGRFPLPSWLGARPRPADRCYVTQEQAQRFLDEEGVLDTTRKLKEFVKNEILPYIPIMVGIDHSATGGVVSALTEELGSSRLSVIVLDHHFDAFPLSVRMQPVLGKIPRHPSWSKLLVGNDVYCCGNFWAHLIENGTLRPEHLFFVGVADYPAKQSSPEWETFQNSYYDFEKRGCNFFPLRAFKGAYKKRLRRFLMDRISTPYVYVSLDLDVGAYRCVHAARYMDGVGIDQEAILDTAHIIAQGCRACRFELAGLDVMEFNMHLLGLKTAAGVVDTTIELATNFICTLIL
jgi:arginase family enzyme